MPSSVETIVPLTGARLLTPGLTSVQVADKLNLSPAVVSHIRSTLAEIVRFANASGVPASAMAVLAGDEIRPLIEASVSAAYATPEEGLAFLLEAEGGCGDVEEATRLYRRPDPVTSATITERIRNGGIIAYRTAANQYRIPRWQFKRSGGVLEGMAEILAMLRASDSSYNALTPFAFFLQPHPLTGERTPLEALRAGDVERVLRAAKSEAE